MSVQDIDLDLIGYGGKKDFQVLSSYVDKNRYVVTVIRLDTTSDEGWTEKLKVLVFFRKSNKTNTILFLFYMPQFQSHFIKWQALLQQNFPSTRITRRLFFNILLRRVLTGYSMRM